MGEDTYSFARMYAARGWKLVALHWVTAAGQCSCGRPGCKAAGKHPRDKAWSEPGRDSMPGRWNGGASLENIGILTGTPSGFWVLDYDPMGRDAVNLAGSQLYGRLLDAGLHPHVRTGGGGYHWRFELPDFEVRNRQSAGGGHGRTHRLPAGWDVRGEGGQVVAPPSVSAKGAYVALIEGDAPEEPPPYVAPAWLLELIRPVERVDAPANHQVSTALPTGTPPGVGRPEVGVNRAGAGEGSAHSPEQVQAYATAALRAECQEYASLTDGRRGEAMAAFARRLVELANMAGWPLDAVYPHFEHAATVAAGNAGPGGSRGGYAPHEIPAQWQRAIEHVGDRPAVMPPGPDVMPGFLLAGAAAPTGWNFVDPGAASLPAGDGVTTVGGTVTATTQAPNLPPSVPPPGLTPNQWAKVQALDDLEAAKRFREQRAAGDVASRLTAMRSEIIDAKALKLRPRLRPIVTGLLYRNTLARINGASGDGKSLIVLDLAAAVAGGTPWAGRPTVPGTVVYLVAEGEEGVGGRIEAWETHHGREFPSGVLFLPRPVQVMSEEWPILTATLAEIGPALVIGDTQARMTSGVNEIDNTELGQVVERLDGLRVATGAAVLLVHHYGTRGERGRGGTAITGALQTELGVKRTGRVIEVTNPKSKDDAEMKPILFDLLSVPIAGPADENGFTEPGRTGAVAVYRGDAMTSEERREDEYIKRARKVWDIMYAARGVPGQTYSEIRDAMGEAINWTGSRTGLNSAFTRAWALLIERGLVAYRKQRFKIIEVQNQGADGNLTANPDLAAGGVGVLDVAEWQLLTSGIDEKLAEERKKTGPPDSSLTR